MVRWIRDGMPFRIASARFLDGFYAAPPADRQGMLDPEPDLTRDAVTDALVGAIGEHLAQRWGLLTPAWVADPARFLRTPWYATRLQDLHPRLTVESPLAFRRRMLFVEREPLNRARMHEITQ
jgi:hypothetical protein